MRKLIQNRISGSRLTLPATSIYALAIWFIGGVLQEQWWLQLACFAITAYLVILLNNMNSLIRVYSRFMSAFFLALGCCDCLLFPSINESVTVLFFVLSYLVLFMSYQDKTRTGTVLYAFIAMGIASMCNVHMLCLVPLFWLFMKYNLLALSWRTWLASILGVLTPYWFAECWYFYRGEPWILLEHLQPLATFGPIADYSVVTPGQAALYILLVVLGVMGSIHFIHKSYLDSIRVRLLYSIFIWMDLILAIFLALQPQHYNLLIRLMIVNTSPLVAHFFALTSTKVTNVVFYTTLTAIITLTVYNLWTASLNF